MQVTVTRKALADALSVVGRAVSAHTSLPVLKNILLEVHPNSLRLAATDLELSIDTTIEGRVERDGWTTVPAGTFSEIIRALPEADVTLELQAETLHLTCRRSAYQIRTLPAEDFPALPEIPQGQTLLIAGRELRRLINQSIYAAASDGTRPVFTGCCLTNGKLAATDTHRLGIAEAEFSIEGEFIIPSSVLREVLRSLPDGEIRIDLSPNILAFRLGHTTIIGRVIDGQFPKYDRVIPKSSSVFWTCDRESLQQALKRVRIIAASSPSTDRVTFKQELGSLWLSAVSELGQANEELELSRCESPDSAFTLAMNGLYVADALSAMEEPTVTLAMTEPLSPVAIKGDGGLNLAIVMPMQVQ